MQSLDYKKFESAEVFYNQIGDYVYVQYLNPSKSDDFKATWNYALELKIKYRTNKWLIDKTFENVYPADMKWLYNVWVKKSNASSPLSENNPRYIAMIMPLNFYCQYSVEEFIRKNSSPTYVFHLCKDHEEAHAWFIQLNGQKYNL